MKVPNLVIAADYIEAELEQELGNARVHHQQGGGGVSCEVI